MVVQPGLRKMQILVPSPIISKQSLPRTERSNCLRSVYGIVCLQYCLWIWSKYVKEVKASRKSPHYMIYVTYNFSKLLCKGSKYVKEVKTHNIFKCPILQEVKRHMQYTYNYNCLILHDSAFVGLYLAHPILL